MSLTPGARLGPYVIADLLGQGGMGQVFRARDTRLDRDVAIKILPEAFARDPDRLARFEREAKTLASLNHPNIAQIYGIEDADGVGALVMELVDGVTLAEVIDRAVDHAPSGSEARPAVGVGPHGKPGKDGGIPIADALAIARQIADALEAAHEAGIIHRDLKPANIKIKGAWGPTPTRLPDGRLAPARSAPDIADGTVKVLDFGLAKLVEPGGGDASGAAAGALSGLSQSPTMTSPAMTQAGMILGTAAYMSPEQAKGRPADKRSDVWAFGCVLYEMLTGTRAFAGEDVSDTLAAILRGEPDWTALPAATPTGVRKALHRCLEKDRKKRLRDIGDVNILIEEADASQPVSPAAGARRSRPLTWGLASALLVGLAAVVFAYWPRPGEPLRPIRFAVPQPDGMAVSGLGLGFALSPDGQHLAGLGVRSSDGVQLIFVRDMETLESRVLEGTDGAVQPFWSPDNRRLGFFANGLLKTIDASGGPVRTLCPAPGTSLGGTWNQDDVVVFRSNGLPGLNRVSAAGGQPSLVTKADRDPASGSYRAPWFLPDGRHFLFTVGPPSNEVRLGSLDSVETTTLPLETTASRVEFASGYLLFIRQGTLMAQPFDAARAQLTGGVVPVAEQVPENPPAGAAGFAVSANGHLAYRHDLNADQTQLTWLDRSGKPSGTVGPPGRYRNPALSPDGKRVAVELVRQDSNRDIWILDLERGTSARLTTDPGNDVLPKWSPTGDRLVFGSDRPGGAFSLYEKTPGTAAPEDLLFKSTLENAVPYGWSPDGKFILHRFMNSGSYNIGVLSLDGDRKSRLYDPIPFLQAFGQVSPSGRWMAYHSNQTTRIEVFVGTFPAAGGFRTVSTEGGVFPRWRSDGTELFYYGLDERLMAVKVSDGATLELGKTEPLFKVRMLNGPISSVGFGPQYDVTRDGQRFLVNLAVESIKSPSITVLRNWTSALGASK